MHGDGGGFGNEVISFQLWCGNGALFVGREDFRADDGGGILPADLGDNRYLYGVKRRRGCGIEKDHALRGGDALR